MRLELLEVDGFRGFPGRYSFDINADAIIVSGSNGQGKTSFFDALMWGVTGTLPRLGEDPQAVRSLYSTSGQTRVRVILSNSDAEKIEITRSLTDDHPRTTVQVGDMKREGEAAQTYILERVWRDALIAQDNQRAFVSALTTCVYLQQDLVSDFIDAQDDKQRFAAVGELVGTGRITELQLELEKQKKAWSRATNELDSYLTERQSRLERLQLELSSLEDASQIPVDVLNSTWLAWWKDFSALTSQPPVSDPVSSSGTSSMLDRAVRDLLAFRSHSAQRRDRLRSLVDSVQRLHIDSGSHLPNANDLTVSLTDIRIRLDATRRQLATAESDAADVRRQLTQHRDASQELLALKQLALRHLTEVCPVCEQRIDADAVALRLRAESDAPLGDAHSQSHVDSSIGVLADAIAQLEASERRTLAQLRLTQDARRVLDELRDLELSIDEIDEDTLGTLKNAVVEWARRFDDASLLIKRAEELAVLVSRIGEQSRRLELSKLISSSAIEVNRLKGDLTRRGTAASLAGAILDSLRDAASEVVTLKLKEVEPILQQMYSTIDPHPSFRTVRFLTDIARGRGRLSASIHDSAHEAKSEHPGRVLSSSQLNALAVAIFLALNMGMSRPPLDVAMLDDPLQSLDNVNLLGIVDLLRRLRSFRQLIVSSHDDRFAELLETKLRPVAEGQRTRVVCFSGWGRFGPKVEMYDVRKQEPELRLVASNR